MAAPKRFPNRDQVADVRAEAEALEPGDEAAEPRRFAEESRRRLNFLRPVFIPRVAERRRAKPASATDVR
jgi:hypothetical protein